MFSEELLLVQTVIDQINGISVEELTLQEYLLHVRSIVAPFMGALKSKWALDELGQILELAKGKVLMAIIFAAVQSKFPKFDLLIEDAIERFIASHGTNYTYHYILL